jgi:hypothetical protein
MKTINNKKWVHVDFALPDTPRWVWICGYEISGKLSTGIGYFDDVYWRFTSDKIVDFEIIYWMMLTKPDKPNKKNTEGYVKP